MNKVHKDIQPLEDSLVKYIEQASMVLQKFLKETLVQAKQDLSLDEFNILFHLNMQEGIPQQWIANHLLRDKTAIMRYIDNLSEKKLVKRMPDPNDRRVNLIFLSQRGKDLVLKLLPLAKNAFQEIEKNLDSDDLNTTKSILRKINKKFHP